MFDKAIAFVARVTGLFAGFNEQCVSAFWAFNLSVGEGEEYSAEGAVNLWTQLGLPYVWDTYDRVTEGFQYADQVIWSGTSGAYTNDGYGHVAFFSHWDSESGFLWCYSQNPNRFGLVRLSSSGIVGALRLKSLRPVPTAPTVYNVKTLNEVAVRVMASSLSPESSDFPEGIAGGVIIAARGLVRGQRPYADRTDMWVRTVNDRYIWAGNIESEGAGLPVLF